MRHFLFLYWVFRSCFLLFVKCELLVICFACLLLIQWQRSIIHEHMELNFFLRWGNLLTLEIIFCWSVSVERGHYARHSPLTKACDSSLTHLQRLEVERTRSSAKSLWRTRKIVANASYSPPTATLHTASSFNLITHKHSNSVGPDSSVEPTHPLLCEDNLVKAATSFLFLEVRRSAEYF